VGALELVAASPNQGPLAAALREALSASAFPAWAEVPCNELPL
jgi:hypothetical protein